MQGLVTVNEFVVRPLSFVVSSGFKAKVFADDGQRSTNAGVYWAEAVRVPGGVNFSTEWSTGLTTSWR